MRTTKDMTKPVRNFDTACHIVGAVCNHFGVTLAQLESHARPERLVWPRFVAIGLLAKYTDWNHETIGDFVNKGRSNISTALKTFNDRLETDAKASEEVAQIEGRL